MTKNIFFLLFLIAVFSSCNQSKNKADAYGNFESTEIIISAEGSGKIISLPISEGQTLKADDVIACVDTMKLHYTKLQLLAAKSGVATKNSVIAAQLDVLNQQKKTAQFEKERIQKLMAKNAVPTKQYDDINAQLALIEKQMQQVQAQNPSVGSELMSFDEQINQVQDALNKSVVHSPIDGTVLAKYAEENEVTTIGKPILKIADMKEMVLRVYVSEAQLSQIKLNQKVKVKVDDGDKEKEMSGTVSWVSPQAEFTPKIIQTKDERANMVYAVKINVVNDGSLKIGMPGEVYLK